MEISTPLMLLVWAWFTIATLYVVWMVETYGDIVLLRKARESIKMSANQAVLDAMKKHPGGKIGMYMNIPVLYVNRDYLAPLYGLNGERRN